MTDKKVENVAVSSTVDKDRKEAQAILDLGDSALVSVSKLTPKSPPKRKPIIKKDDPVPDDDYEMDYGYGMFSSSSSKDVDNEFSKLKAVHAAPFQTSGVSSLPKLIVAGVEIELTKYEGELGTHHPSTMNHFTFETNSCSGKNTYGNYQEYTDAANKNKNWYIAQVNGIRILMTPGSEIITDRLEGNSDFFYYEGGELTATLVVRYSSIKADTIHVRKTPKITNTCIEARSLYLIGGMVKHSTIKAGDDVTLDNVAFTGVRATLRTLFSGPEAVARNSRFENLGSVRLVEGKKVENCNIHAWKDPFTAGVAINDSVDGLDISNLPAGSNILISHRSDYGAIQGLRPVHFVKAVSGLYSTLPIGMIINGILLKSEDVLNKPLIQPHHTPWSPPPQVAEVTPLEQLVREIYNSDIFRPTISNRNNNFGQDDVSLQIQPALREQLDNIENQIVSRMKLWELTHTLLGGS